MQDEKVDFTRICLLEVGDRFMWQGTWFRVTKITDEKLLYTHTSNNIGRSGKYSFGAKSQMIVQVVKNTNLK